MPARGASAFVKLSIGTVYLVGGSFLLPGFVWIVPTNVIHIPVHFDNVTHQPDAFAYVPIFDASVYATGVHALIVGMTLVLFASVADLLCVHCRESAGASTMPTATAPMLLSPEQPSKRKQSPLRLLSPFAQMLGAAFILAGCVIFLPVYSLPGFNQPPVQIWGTSAPDLASLCFQIASVLYFMGALLAIVGVRSALRDATLSVRRARSLKVSVVAFTLFIATSVLFFLNGQLPKAHAVTAGNMRLAGAICMMVAIVMLFGVELDAACAPPP